jgi:signal transduction histidine kinase
MHEPLRLRGSIPKQFAASLLVEAPITRASVCAARVAAVSMSVVWRTYVEQIIANLLRNAAKFQDPFIIKRDRGASGRPRITGAPGSRS